MERASSRHRVAIGDSSFGQASFRKSFQPSQLVRTRALIRRASSYSLLFRLYTRAML